MALALAERPRFDDLDLSEGKSILDRILSGEGAGRESEYDSDPLLHQAAAFLIDLHKGGRTVEMEVEKTPYTVLAEVHAWLMQLGASTSVSGPILDTLDAYILTLGANFTREARAKPLRAHIRVTNIRPEQKEGMTRVIVALNGTSRIGEGYSTRSISFTAHGTKSTATKEIDLAQFAMMGQEFFLVLEFETRENNADLTSIEAMMTDLTLIAGGDQALYEALMADGAALSTPEIAALIAALTDMKDIAQVLANDPANMAAQDRLAELAGDIAGMVDSLQSGDVPMPESLLSAVRDTLQTLLTNPAIASLLPAEALALTADNDNAAGSMIRPAEELLALLETLDGMENLPPELQAILETLDRAGLTAESLAAVLAGQGGDPALTESVKSLILALADPAVMDGLPKDAGAAVQAFMQDNASAVDAVVLAAVVSDLRAAAETLGADSAEAREMIALADRLEAGEITLKTIEPAALKAMVATLGAQGEGAASAVKMMEQAIRTVENAQSASSVSLSSATLAVLESIAQGNTLDSDARDALKEALKTGDTSKILDLIAERPDLVEKIKAAGSNVIDLGQNFSPNAAASQLNAMADLLENSKIPGTHLPAEIQVAIANMESVAKFLQTAGSGLYSAPDVVPVLAQLDQAIQTAKDPVRRAEIEAIREQIVQKTQGLSPELKKPGPPAPKPDCWPICKCHEKAAEKPPVDKDGNLVLLRGKGIITAEAIANDREIQKAVNESLKEKGIVSEDERQRRRLGSGPSDTLPDVPLPDIKQEFEHVHSPDCEHNRTLDQQQKVKTKIVEAETDEEYDSYEEFSVDDFDKPTPQTVESEKEGPGCGGKKCNVDCKKCFTDSAEETSKIDQETNDLLNSMYDDAEPENDEKRNYVPVPKAA